ncbi:hypothetical protein J7I80_06870 [Bacillus sp. ISL-41]|uniref:hypothetical protein n=1 Tax=Bacillus sp. ISL-41 TaxID=2819127 RepID=UPI001BECE345|nr:hypothetical protein [Bacillus sp. ISL-41]MBT2641940.1 hypothetical protein [Bacillus sp. ISL-41]
MKIYEVIQTKEVLCGEFIENYHVIYEEIESRDYEDKHNCLIEKSSIVQKYITIFRGNSCSTLQKIKAYSIEKLDIAKIRKIIANDYPELFKDVQFTCRAV